jgi:hypothetical protein
MDLVRARPLRRIDSIKSMITLRFSIYVSLALSDFPKDVDMSNWYFCNVVLKEVKQGVMTIAKKSHPASPLKVP